MRKRRSAERFLRKKGKKKDDLWPFLKEKYDIGLELRRPYEQRWLINLSFIAGRQYAFYNEATNLLQQLTTPKGRLRVVDNKILPRFQKQVSRMIRNNPRMSVIPSTTDQEDLKAAKLGDKVLKWYWRQHQMRKKIRQLSGWIYSCGNGYLDDRWNPKLGPVTVDEKSGKMLYTGDVETGVWSPFEIGVPAGGIHDQDLESFSWMWKAKFRPLQWFPANYKGGEKVPSETRPIPYTDASVLFGNSERSMTHTLPGAVWIELKVKPNDEFPNGLLLAGASGVILEKDDYPFDSYHIEQFKDIEVPGIYHGMATTEAAIWLQKLWNRNLSDIAEFNRAMARGKWKIPRGCKLEVAPDDSHGQMLLYNPVMGHGPEMVDIKGLPATYQQVLELVALSLMELYHQHEVTQGTNKSDIRSGEMVSLLLEQDDFGNVPTHAVFEESLEAVMKRVLKRIQKGYKNDRVVTITGRDLEHEVFNFKGADLRNNTDVKVAKESSLPDSKVARQARIKENYGTGLYGDPMDERTRERVLRMLDEVPDDIRDIFKEAHLDRQNAQLENRAMSSQAGIELVVNPYDNHAVHMEEHRLYKKQPEYQRLKFNSPEQFAQLEVIFLMHEKLHNAFLAKEEKAEDTRMAKVIQMKKGGAS